MKIQLIRNATMKITYAGRTLLTDPMLAPKHDIESFAGISRNPTIELPFQAEAILEGVESVLVSHYHQDHFDKTAGKLLPKNLPLFCQPVDEARMTDTGFANVIPVETAHTWEGINIIRTDGRHGSGEMLERMGPVSGFVLQAEGEPTVYWAGDSIWCDQVEKAIKRFSPDIIITHSGGAEIGDSGYIIMDDEQTITTAQAAPESLVVAIHMESLDHCKTNRTMLRKRADQVKIASSRLIILEDGESVILN